MRKSEANKTNDPLLQHCEDIIRSSTFSDQPFFDPQKSCDFLDSMTQMDQAGIDEASPLIRRMATVSLMQQRFGISA